jgi:hypothetical protein
VVEQPLIEGSKFGVMAAARQSSHVEHVPYVCAPAPHHALSTPGTAIAVKRRHPDQSLIIAFRSSLSPEELFQALEALVKPSDDG